MVVERLVHRLMFKTKDSPIVRSIGRENFWRKTLLGALLPSVVILYPLSPSLSWIAGGLLLAAAGKKSAAILWSFFAFIPIAIVVNGSKEIAGDWEWYRHQFFEYQGLGLLDIFGSTFNPSNKLYEPLYYSSSWIIANVFPGETAFLVFFILLLVYGALTAATALLSQHLQLNPFRTLSLLYILFGFGMTFTLVTQLVRQSIAVSLLVLVLALIIRKKWIAASIITVIAVTIHTPAAVLGSLIFLGSALVFRYGARAIAWMPMIGLILGAAYWWFSGRGYAGANDGSVSVLLVVFDIAVLVGLMVGANHMPKRKADFSRLLASVMILQLTFVLGTILEPLPALRFYLYITPFTALGAFLLLDLLLTKRLSPRVEAFLSASIGIAAVFLMQFRISRSPFLFDIQIADTLLML